ncbi:GNAT family N-acetyltransferase [Candidatus Saccharibacteria bacterium]|nr:GNAT family N-acetyltransferase [Candidatus Saccharibacteria bacterium]
MAKYQVRKFPSVRAAKKLFDEAKDWPKKGPQEYPVLKGCDILFRYLRLKKRVTVFGVYEEDKLVAIMPIRFMTDGSAQIAGSFERLDFVDFIYNPELKNRAISVARFFVNYLKNEYKINKFTTRFIDVKSPTYKALKKFEKFNVDKVWENVIINFPSKSYDEYFSKLTKHGKQNIRTAYNRAEKKDIEISLTVYSNVLGAGGPAEKVDKKNCLELYIKRQLKTYVTERASTYAFRTKHFQYLSVSSRINPNAFFAVLKMNGEIAAFMEGFYNPFDKSIEIPRLAMNDKMRFYSPGMILVNEVIKKYIKDKKVLSLNLLRGNEPYKFAMGGKSYRTDEVTVKLA